MNAACATPGVELHHAVLHGGWEGSQICTIFVYLLCLRCYIIVTARALANHKNVHRPVYPPSLLSFRRTLNGPREIALDNCITKLFKVSNPAFQKEGRLRPLLDVCFASFLRWMDLMILQCGSRHESILYFTTTVEHYGFNVKQMKDAVVDDYVFNNHSTATGNEIGGTAFYEFCDAVTSRMNKMNGELDQLRLQTRTFQEQTSRDLRDHGTKIDQILNILQELQQGSRAATMSPVGGGADDTRRKRRALDTDVSPRAQTPETEGGVLGPSTRFDDAEGIFKMYDAVIYV